MNTFMPDNPRVVQDGTCREVVNNIAPELKVTITHNPVEFNALSSWT